MTSEQEILSTLISGEKSLPTLILRPQSPTTNWFEKHSTRVDGPVISPKSDLFLILPATNQQP